ncbi:helix-turn-helix domain-containing protein [Actinomadura formosensis]|uniref:helix-turn-helix domain-containing protein n=1 Tax=Actinomadura formosensis TaxID=60706 RepID=UPI00082C2730|nr:helix-turn-helix transcriptional regulator [Actinomadura formosensis]
MTFSETFGEALRRLMADRGIGVRALARQVPCDAGHVSELCHGHKGPSDQLAARLDEILSAAGELVALTRTTPEDAVQVGSVNSGAVHADDLDEDDEMQRRRLLQALTTLGAASSPAVEAIECIRDGVDRAIGRDESSHLGEWEETVAEYGYTYLLLPPQLLLRELASDLVAVQRIAGRRTQGRLTPSWYRVTGVLAALMAKTLCNMGQPRMARAWWVTAQHAADTSGDLDLGLWIAGERLVYGLYENRPPAILLCKADRMADRAPGISCRGLLHVRTVRAQLLALEGAEAEATAELQACEEIFGRLPMSVTGEVRSVAGWAEDRLRYTEAWVYAHTGDHDRLDAAAARAVAVLPSDDPRVRVQLDLLRAAGHVRAGDTSEGVRHAHAVYEAQPDEHRTVMVTSLARQVAEAVPAHSRDEPVVAGYRELLASGPRRAIT